MSEERNRQRTRDQAGSGNNGEGNEGGPDRIAIQDRANRLRSLGSGIIQNALSGNSERYLEQGKQMGGQ